MSIHKEISFESEICAYLGAHGWLYTEGDGDNDYAAKALYHPDLTAWLQATQPQAWEAPVKAHGGANAGSSPPPPP